MLIDLLFAGGRLLGCPAFLSSPFPVWNPTRLSCVFLLPRMEKGLRVAFVDIFKNCLHFSSTIAATIPLATYRPSSVRKFSGQVRIETTFAQSLFINLERNFILAANLHFVSEVEHAQIQCSDRIHRIQRLFLEMRPNFILEELLRTRTFSPSLLWLLQRSMYRREEGEKSYA